MNIQFRLATLEDADDFQYIKQTVWPDESAEIEKIHNGLSLAAHTCYVAIAENHIIGFMDCFPTENQNAIRMEMDLLAVLPQYQGNKIASRLIRHCLYHPHMTQPTIYRALIRVNNIASQKAFQHNGFTLQPEILTLYVTSGNDQKTTGKRKGFTGNLIPVQTMNYDGYWIEAPFKKGNLTLPEMRETIGTLLPQDEILQKRATQAGFSSVADYQWWTLQTPLPPAFSNIKN